MDKVEVDSVVLVADLHAGCQMGLCPSRGVKLDGGGVYRPGDFQRKVHAWWRTFWTDWVPTVTRGSKFAVILNGDAMDGRHHGTTTQISQNLSDQKLIALALLEPVVKQCGGRFYFIRGTEAHSGPSSENEEDLARELGAIPDPAGNHARYELFKWLHGRHSLVHCLHHIGSTGSAAYESTAVHKEYIAALTESARWGLRPPDVVVRAHRHRYFKTEVSSSRERGLAVVLPGWQGKTPLCFRIEGARLSPPQFGGVMLRVSAEGELYERHFVKALRRPSIE